MLQRVSKPPNSSIAALQAHCQGLTAPWRACCNLEIFFVRMDGGRSDFQNAPYEMYIHMTFIHNYLQYIYIYIYVYVYILYCICAYDVCTCIQIHMMYVYAYVHMLAVVGGATGSFFLEAPRWILAPWRPFFSAFKARD